MKFNQISEDRWESEEQAYSAVALNGNREAVGIKEARFVILKGELKGKEIYRVYEQHVGRKELVGKGRTLEQAIKIINR